MRRGSGGLAGVGTADRGRSRADPGMPRGGSTDPRRRNRGAGGPRSGAVPRRSGGPLIGGGGARRIAGIGVRDRLTEGHRQTDTQRRRGRAKPTADHGHVLRARLWSTLKNRRRAAHYSSVVPIGLPHKVRMGRQCRRARPSVGRR